MKIIIDALSISFKFNNVANLKQQLGLEDLNLEETRTRYYNSGLYYAGIKIFYNENFGIIEDTMLDLSGSGCRMVEQLNKNFDWFNFLNSYDEQILSRQVHISRIDIACDLTDGSIPISLIQKYSRAELYVCKSKVLPDVRYMRTEEVYFGSPRSDRLLRIYNKALEQGIPDTDWVRFEFQLRNDNATSWYLNWKQEKDVGKLFKGVMLDFLRFVSPQVGSSIKEIKKNRNQGRMETAPWWSQFLGEVEKVPQLYLPAFEFTVEMLDRYMEKMQASSLGTYLIAHDGDITKLIAAARLSDQNPRQKLLLQKLEAEKHLIDEEEKEYAELERKAIQKF